jgi:hypothetical protein
MNNINNDDNDNDDNDDDGQIEMIESEPYIDYNECGECDLENYYDNSDQLSEFSEYREKDFDKEDDLDSCLDFQFDFDIVFTPENKSKLLQVTEIKSKIVNRIKLNAQDLLHIKYMEHDEKMDIIKLFNHMV